MIGKSVLVTGPNRAGTTYIAKCLASDLGFRYVDETEYGFDNIDIITQWLQGGNRQMVIQGPAMMHLAHAFPGLVVICRRPIADIVASQNRVNWTGELDEQRKYRLTGLDLDLPISVVKYRHWDKHQKKSCRTSLDIEYDSLKNREDWVHDRRHFTIKQTK